MLEKQLIPEIFCLHGAYYNGQTDFVGIHYFFCGQSKYIVNDKTSATRATKSLIP